MGRRFCHGQNSACTQRLLQMLLGMTFGLAAQIRLAAVCHAKSKRHHRRHAQGMKRWHEAWTSSREALGSAAIPRKILKLRRVYTDITGAKTNATVDSGSLVTAPVMSV